jgi:hypothetical protein
VIMAKHMRACSVISGPNDDQFQPHAPDRANVPSTHLFRATISSILFQPLFGGEVLNYYACDAVACTQVLCYLDVFGTVSALFRMNTVKGRWQMACGRSTDGRQVQL